MVYLLLENGLFTVLWFSMYIVLTQKAFVCSNSTILEKSVNDNRI